MTTKTLNLIGANRFAILPVVSSNEDGAFSELRFYPLNAEIETGAPICPKSLEESGVQPELIISFDSSTKVAALVHQAGRMYQDHASLEQVVEAAKKVEERDSEMAHIEEMARQLAERQRKFEAKYGPANKGPQHAANMDAYAGNLAQALAQALDGQVVTMKV
ncbi:MAG: hypothetical protein ACRDC4_12470 [Plesiomonas sp.]